MVRSIAAISSAAISIGAASIISQEVVYAPHTKIGSRDQVIPRARMVVIVTIRLNPNSVIDRPTSAKKQDVRVVAGGALGPQRLVARPAGLEAAKEDRREQDHLAGHQKPERERREARERHPPRADHQRHQERGKRPQQPRGHGPHHHRPVHADQRQVLVGAEHVHVGLKQLGPDQHRVEPGDEEEQPDPHHVLLGDDLVVGRQREVPKDALLLGLALGQRRGMPEHPLQRVVGKAQADEEADHAEDVAEHDRDVVLARLRGVVREVRAGEALADPVADEPPHDPEDDPGHDVEADQPSPAGARGVCRHCSRAHPALLNGSGK